jgi:hypothetical protein
MLRGCTIQTALFNLTTRTLRGIYLSFKYYGLSELTAAIVKLWLSPGY